MKKKEISESGVCNKRKKKRADDSLRVQRNKIKLKFSSFFCKAYKFSIEYFSGIKDEK